MSDVKETGRRGSREGLDRGSRMERGKVDREPRHVLGDGPDRSSHGGGAKDRLRRLERIGERDSMRHLPSFDAGRALDLERFEVRTNPRGFQRREAGKGLDRETERELRASLRKRRGRG